MPSVETELWNIFTYYTLHGDPLDPEHIKLTQFVRLCKDCEILGQQGLSSPDLNVLYRSEVTRGHAAKRAEAKARAMNEGYKARAGAGVVANDKMNFNCFLNAIMKLSSLVYPTAPRVDDAFQQLLMDHVLPLASRRVPVDVDQFMADPGVREVFSFFDKALGQIFEYYATDRGRKRGAKRSPTKGNTMTDALGYREFLRFAKDFNLSSSVILSTLEIGDIFLTCVELTSGEDQIGKLSPRRFREALLRSALVAYSKISAATVVDKLKGLFLYMWRAMNDNVPKNFAQGQISTYSGSLMAGAMTFNTRFTAMWQQDGYRDYLAEDEERAEDARDVLKRLSAPSDHAAARPLADMDRTGEWRARLGKHSPGAASAGAASEAAASARTPQKAMPVPAASAARGGAAPISGKAASPAAPAAASPGAAPSFTTEQLSRVLRDNPELMDVLKRTLEAKQE